MVERSVAKPITAPQFASTKYDTGAQSNLHPRVRPCLPLSYAHGYDIRGGNTFPSRLDVDLALHVQPLASEAKRGGNGLCVGDHLAISAL